MSTLVCENPFCKKVYMGRVDKRCLHNYCSHSCAVSVNNKMYPRNPGKIKICVYCKKEFKSRQKYCSLKCKNLGSCISKSVLLKSIKEFTEMNGRVPYKWELGNYGAARARFGTWNKAITAAGFTPNPVMFAKKYIAKDGHKCDSLAEKIIDDCLFKRDISHIRNFPYPGNKRFTVDFKVEDKWIEFFGLSGQLKRYDQLMKEKLKLVKKYNLKFVPIFPHDLFAKNQLEVKLRGLRPN